ncbi:(Fe-S)-binding protein [Marinithermofilum abyssi]|nr:(Fe-S)-binding protein [Marinithermofilum abyssi]
MNIATTETATSPSRSLGNYLAGDVPDENKWADCVHCGLCLEACPTYLETGHEHQSPRGRVHLIKSVADGKIELNESFMDPVFTCLDCRACETACPANVQVGGLIEEARGQIRRAMPLKGWRGAVSRFFLNGVFPNPDRLTKLGGLLKFLRKSGLLALARKTGLIKVLPSHLEEMERVTPEIGVPVRKKFPEVIPVRGERKKRVGLLTGCVMDVVFSNVNEATVRVLTQNGYEVHVPRDQTCCGALHVHAGDRESGRKLARKNIEAFNDAEHVLVNAAGCGCAMKEYPELFREDPESREKAEAFAEKVTDVSKFLYDHGFEPPKGRIDARVTYHDACHLAHGQGVREEPRSLLREIPGLELVDMPHADRCCGSAGIYNLTHPEMAGAILEQKMTYVPEEVELISMGNPGCMLQMAVGVLRHGRSAKVVHTMELLDRSYQIEDQTGTDREV